MRTPYRIMFPAVFVVLLLGTTRVIAAETPSRPNIIFIMADDHTSQAWGCYGGRLARFAKTPNIDRLAREGARLTNCFCTNSICVPSRGAILTGQYSHINGIKTLSGSLDLGKPVVQPGAHCTAEVGDRQ